MFWDTAIFYLGISWAVAGWNAGLFNSWPAPISILVATGVAHSFYMDFSMWILDQTRLPGELSFFVGYVLLWILVESLLEMLLSNFVPIKRQFEVDKRSRCLGACLGVAKAFVIVVLAATASASSIIAPVPPDCPPIATWLTDSSRTSVVLRLGHNAAKHLPEAIVGQIITRDEPRYVPQFEDTNVVRVNQERVEGYRGFFDTLRKLEQL